MVLIYNLVNGGKRMINSTAPGDEKMACCDDTYGGREWS